MEEYQIKQALSRKIRRGTAGKCHFVPRGESTALRGQGTDGYLDHETLFAGAQSCCRCEKIASTRKARAAL